MIMIRFKGVFYLGVILFSISMFSQKNEVDFKVDYESF